MWRRWIRHLAAGATGTALYMVAVGLGVELVGLHPLTAVVLAFALSVVFSYSANRIWVYAPGRGHGYAVPRFLAGVALGAALNYGIMFGAVEVLDLWYGWGLAGAAFVVPPTNFLINYLWAFR